MDSNGGRASLGWVHPHTQGHVTDDEVADDSNRRPDDDQLEIMGWSLGIDYANAFDLEVGPTDGDCEDFLLEHPHFLPHPADWPDMDGDDPWAWWSHRSWSNEVLHELITWWCIKSYDPPLPWGDFLPFELAS